MLEPIEIELGGQTYRLQPPTFAVLEALEPIMLTAASATRVQFAGGVVKLAMSFNHPDVNVDQLQTTPTELDIAALAYARFTGFLPPAEVNADG